MQEGEENHIQLFEAREDATEALESAKEPFDFIALLVEGTIIFPRLDAVGLERNYRDHAENKHQFPGQVVLVGFCPSA